MLVGDGPQTEETMGNLITFIIFGIIGVFCIFNLTVGKRNRQMAAQHNRDVFGALSNKCIEEFGRAKFDKMKKVPYMGDNSNGYILCFDKKSDIMAMVTYDDIFTMKYSSKKSCEIIIEGDDKSYSKLVCHISAPELENDLDICLAQSRHRRKSFMGKAILQDAQEMQDIITGKISVDGED